MSVDFSLLFRYATTDLIWKKCSTADLTALHAHPGIHHPVYSALKVRDDNFLLLHVNTTLTELRLKVGKRRRTWFAFFLSKVVSSGLFL